MTIKTKTKKTVGAIADVTSNAILRRRSRIKVGVGDMDDDIELLIADANLEQTDAVAVTNLNSMVCVPRHPESQPAVVGKRSESDVGSGDCGIESSEDGGGAGRDAERAIASILPQLLDLTRQRRREQKLRIGIEQTALATVKNALGYGTWLSEEERKSFGDRAGEIVKAATLRCDINEALLIGGKRAESAVKRASDKLDALSLSDADNRILDEIGMIVAAHHQVAKMHSRRISEQEKTIAALIERLPISNWLHADEQLGFGSSSLATILGETGDLSLYSSPAKLWKRMGCAPFRGKAPSTWRREGGLNAKEWTEASYSPQRRSMMYVIADCLIKLNKSKDGRVMPYRARYDEAKRTAAESHPEWKPCRLHAHGNLLCGKRLLRELWRAWRDSYISV